MGLSSRGLPLGVGGVPPPRSCPPRVLLLGVGGAPPPRQRGAIATTDRPEGGPPTVDNYGERILSSKRTSVGRRRGAPAPTTWRNCYHRSARGRASHKVQIRRPIGPRAGLPQPKRAVLDDARNLHPSRWHGINHHLMPILGINFLLKEYL